MSTLDLHGIKHADVKDKLSHYLFWEKPGRSHSTILISPKLCDGI